MSARDILEQERTKQDKHEQFKRGLFQIRDWANDLLEKNIPVEQVQQMADHKARLLKAQLNL